MRWSQVAVTGLRNAGLLVLGSVPHALVVRIREAARRWIAADAARPGRVLCKLGELGWCAPAQALDHAARHECQGGREICAGHRPAEERLRMLASLEAGLMDTPPLGLILQLFWPLLVHVGIAGELRSHISWRSGFNPPWSGLLNPNLLRGHPRLQIFICFKRAQIE